MDILAILLLQTLIYAAFPLYFTTLPYHLRSISFYMYLSILLIFGGFLGSVYSFPITESIRISGGNLNYGAFMMTWILLVIIEGDLDIVRHAIRVVLTVNIFKWLFYQSLVWTLQNEAVINPFQISSQVFEFSLPFSIIGGVLIIAELLIFLLIFSQAKRWIKNIGVLALLYIAFYLLMLVLDGVLFPLLAFSSNPTLVEIIYGNVQGKLVMGSLYIIPMLLFLVLNRQRFVAFVEKDLDFSDLLKSSRRALQVALQDSERRYRLLVDTSPYAIAIYQDEKIVFVNEAACRLIGVEGYESLLGRSLASILPGEKQEESKQAFQQILQSEENHRSFELEILRADGSCIPVEITAVVISYQGHVAVQIIAKDIRERKQAEAAAQQATRLQIELEKERELAKLKMQFTSMIVHDFRNPVASISLSSELIQRHAQNQDMAKVQEKATRISQTAKLLNGQIDDLLELGRAESGLANFAPKKGDIVEFCRQLFYGFQQEHESAKHNYSFTTEVEKQNFSFDPHLMERVLNNLLSNAFKYSPEGGKIQLRMGKAGDCLKIVVFDTGIGIPQEDIECIFEFFQRASNAAHIQGTGIGLAIVKQIVEKHGGTISCESVPEAGTSFTILLPLA